MVESEVLTLDQFVSLLMVGDEGPNDPAPIIPIDHETLLIRLGYVVKLQGRLRVTTSGSMRIASIETVLQDNQPNSKHAQTCGRVLDFGHGDGYCFNS